MKTIISYSEDNHQTPANDNIPYHAPIFNLELFKDELTQYDLTEEQRAQLLLTLWDMMVTCVDTAWNYECTETNCGKLIKDVFDNAADSQGDVESEYTEDMKLSQGGK